MVAQSIHIGVHLVAGNLGSLIRCTLQAESKNKAPITRNIRVDTFSTSHLVILI